MLIPPPSLLCPLVLQCTTIDSVSTNKLFCTLECGLYRHTVQSDTTAASGSAYCLLILVVAVRSRNLHVSVEHFALCHDPPPGGINL